MRNFKKFLALVLAMLMVVSAAATVSAFSDVAEDNQYAAAIADLVEKGIVNGVGDDKFNPDGSVERYQMALMMARALDPDKTNEEWAEGMSIFTDVTEWYGAINYAYMNGIVTGIGNLQFAPHAGIRYQDALIMALRALGYTVDVSGNPYWLAAYNQAAKIGLTKNVAVNKGDHELNRAETAQVIYNMLYTTPADGGATIAAKNFGEATPANTTTFVISATPKQAFANTNKSVDEDYVGIQALVNGLPTGDITYLPVAVLGIEKDKVEDYFAYTVSLVNYDAKTGAFDRAIIGDKPTVITNASVTKNSDEKFTIDGTAYYTVEQIAGAALKNEIVVFNTGAYASAGKILLTNKDGDIVNYNGAVVATFAYQTPSGAKYYVDKDVKDNVKVISESEALQKYGVTINDSAYTEFDTLNAKELAAIGNYQISLFDDDRDGKFERAYVTPIYVGVYNANNWDGTASFGAMKGIKGVAYTNDEAQVKGTVFTYTYNKQTNVVDVLDIVKAQTGTLTKINTSGNNGNAGYAVKLTIDGTEYVLGNTARQNAGLTGANLVDAPAYDFDKIASDAYAVGYIYESTTGWTSLKVGQPIKFYAIGDSIITARTYNLEEAYERVVLKELVSYDSNAVYADLYMNGKLVENVAVTKIDDKVVSGLNVFQLSRLLADNTLFATGNVFRAVKLTDGSYQLSEELNRKVADSREKFGLTTETFGSLITFEDGIADVYNNNGVIAGDRVIRTKDTTVFYFLKKEVVNGVEKIASISTYVGAPTKSSINFANTGIEIYADKIGYGAGDYNGVANFVLVYYTNAEDITGFGVANVGYTTAYIVDNKDKVVTYNMASAADLGLTASEYTGKYFYAYSADGLAVDMANGNKINTIYSEKPIAKNTFVVLSSDNVVLEKQTEKLKTDNAIKYADLNVASFNQTRYYTITDVATGKVIAQYPTNKVSTVKLTKSTGIDVKTDAPKDVLGDATKTVAYIVNFEDGSFVGVSIEDSTVYVDGSANAKWTYNNKGECAAIASDLKKESDTKLTGKVFVATTDGTAQTAIEFKGYNVPFKNVTNITPWKDLGDLKDAKVTINVNGAEKNLEGYFKVDVAVKDGVASYTITSEVDPMKPFSTATKFGSGNYVITINVTREGTPCSFTILQVID